MKNIRLKLFLAIALLHVYMLTQAQIEYSVRLAPNLSLTEVSEASWVTGTFLAKPLLRASTGLSADMYIIKSRLTISSGIWYTIKGFGLSSSEKAIDKPDGSTVYYEEAWHYNLHYFQLPLTLKFFIPNKAATYRFYIQGGLTLDQKILEQALKKDENYFYQLSQTFNNGSDVFNSKDKGLYFGLGGEWKNKNDRWLFASLSFTKGMNWLVTKDFKFNPNDNLRSFADFRVSTIALEMGFKFRSNKPVANLKN